MRITRLAVLMAIGVALPAAAEQWPPSSSTHQIKIVGDAERGEALAKRWCASCHLPDATGAVSDAVPTFHWIGQQARNDPAGIRAFLQHPHPPMPPLELDRTQIADIVAYFDTLAQR